MTEAQKKKTSKFISLILRHDPGMIGIALDSHGWARIDTLIKGLNAHGCPISREELLDIVHTDAKKRYALDERGECIRASQGHSLDIDLELEPCVPPEVLYHGTPTKWADEIRKSGLKKMVRQYVHLSRDLDTARTVARRRGEEHIFSIDAMGMYRDGYKFYCSENGVWLTDEVPPRYLSDASL